MTKDEALKIALEALETALDFDIDAEDDYYLQAITAIKEALAQPEPYTTEAMQVRQAVAKALAQPEQEPVAWAGVDFDIKTTPPQRTWVGLTDEDRQAAFESMPDMLDGFLKTWGWLHFSKAIEDRLKELNT